MKNYISLAQRTSAPITPEIMDRLTDRVKLGLLNYTISEIIRRLQILEEIKKNIFYGRELLGYGAGHLSGEYEEILKRLSKESTVKLLHGAMGKATEAGELLQQVADHIFSGYELDEVNLIEELGDDFWYSAEMCAALNTTFEKIQELNIKKLAARYGEKFSDQAALNRNLINERKELEK